MKNKVYFLIVLLLILSVLINFVQFSIYKKNIINENELMLYDETYDILNSITLENYKKMLDDGENFVVYMGKTGCADCNIFWINFKQILKDYDLNDKIVYVNTERYNSCELYHGMSWVEFKTLNGIKQVPALLFISNGEIKNLIEWDVNDGLSDERLIMWLKENNLI